MSIIGFAALALAGLLGALTLAASGALYPMGVVLATAVVTIYTVRLVVLSR